jgi:hypothetical protein
MYIHKYILIKRKNDRGNNIIDNPKWTLALQKSELQQYIWTSLDEVWLGQKNTEPLDTKRRPSPIVITVFYKKDQYSYFSFSLNN